MSTFDQVAPDSQVSIEPMEKKTSRRSDQNWRIFIMFMLVLMSIIMLTPFAFLVTSSLKSQVEIFQYPPVWIPNPIMWQNYTEALTLKPFGLYVFNTLKIVFLNVIAVVFSSSFCAYGFARIRFWGRDFWFGIVMATLFLPYAILIVPSFIIFSRLGWVDTIAPLTVPLFFGGGAFNIFLLRQFFRTIPEELADAARIDGCTEFGIYWRIMLPLSKPALITVGIFTFLNAWNDLLGPVIYLRSPNNFTIAVGLAGFTSQLSNRWDLLMAAATTMIIPIVILFFFSQRYFIRGIVLTGLKG